MQDLEQGTSSCLANLFSFVGWPFTNLILDRVQSRYPFQSFPGGLLARWKRSGEYDEVVFRVAATIPMKWMERGVPQSLDSLTFSHLPFDVDAFIQELQKESP
jgi:hypothetical protein